MAQEKIKRQRRKIQGVTMSDVAELAKVSPSTVSLFLRQPGSVSPKTGAVIQAAISKLNYVPNMIAGGLAAASSRVVGVVVPSIKNAFFAETVAALQRELEKHNLQLLLGHSEYDAQVEEKLVRMALSWAPAAVVLTGLEHSDATEKSLRATDIPVVEIWELDSKPPIDMAVGFSHFKVGERTAMHLIERGHNHLVYLSGRLHLDRRAAERARGFIETAERMNVSAVHVTRPEAASPEIGGRLFAEFLSSNPARERAGIGCSNDWIALGALFEAQRRGIRIPDDFSLAGFGDLSFAASCNPALTTLRPLGDLIGQNTAELIAARLAGGPVDNIVRDTGFEVVVREST